MVFVIVTSETLIDSFSIILQKCSEVKKIRNGMTAHQKRRLWRGMLVIMDLL